MTVGHGGSGTGRQGRRPGTRGPRIVLVVVAVAVIAFCAWCMSQYVRGEDPLAWLTSQAAFQTTEESSSQGSGGAPSNAGDADGQSPSAGASFDKDDVVSAIGSLTWDGEDVGCQAADVRVVLKADEGIWVEQASGESSSELVGRTARRLAALCAWVRQNGVDAPRVTWIAEDANGYIRMIVRADPQAMDVEGSTADLLGATESYAICYDDYTSDVRDAGVAQTKGDAPTYPDGNRAAVATSREQSQEQERQEEKAKSSAQGGTTQGGSGGSGNANSGGAGSSSSDNTAAGDDAGSDDASGTSGSAASRPSSDDGSPRATPAATVSVSINGSAAGGSSHSAAVAYRDGMTVYDALVAADGNINARDTIYGTYVAAIDGLAEKQHGGMSGWVYAVNGLEPNTACSNYTLNAGDTVVWTYVNVEG